MADEAEQGLSGEQVGAVSDLPIKASRSRVSTGLAILVTLAVAAALFAAQMIRLPSVAELDPFAELGDGPFAELAPVIRNYEPSLSIVALGFVPLLLASGLVELASAFGLPAWRKLREDGVAGHATRRRAAMVLVLPIAAAQAYLVVTRLGALPGYGLGASDQWLAGLTLVAGAFLLAAMAGLLDELGLGRGVPTLVVSALTLQIALHFRVTRRLPWTVGTSLVAALVTASLLMRRPALLEPVGERGPDGLPPRGPRQLRLSALPAGLVAAVAGVSAAEPVSNWLASQVTDGGSTSESLLREVFVVGGVHGVGYVTVVVAVAAVVSAVFASFMDPPTVVAGWWARLTRSEQHVTELAGSVDSALWRATLWGTIYASALLCIGGLPAAIFVVFGFDFWLSRKERLPGSVAVWAETRAVAVPFIRAALRGGGIPCQLEGDVLLQLFPLLGPVSPALVRVRPGDERRATALIRDALSGKRRKRAEKARDLIVSPTERPARMPPTATLAVGTATQVATACSLVLALGLYFFGSGLLRWLDPPPPLPPPATLALMLLDDDADPLEAASRSSVATGVEFSVQNVPIGPGKTAARHVASCKVSQERSLEAARSCLEGFLAKVTPSEGRRWGVGIIFEKNEDSGEVAAVGYRSYLLTGEAVVTEADVLDAQARPQAHGDPGWLVAIEFSPDGGQRFEALTRRAVKRRIAIIIDGVVESAPVVQEPIGGGHVQITMGGAPKQQLADARKLELSLRRAASSHAR